MGVLTKDDILLYFTYQGVIWSMQGATEEADWYFQQVLQVVERNHSGECYKALKWIIEVYGQMQDYTKAWRAMDALKKGHNEEIYRPYFIEAAISISQSEKTRADCIPVSPVLNSGPEADTRMLQSTPSVLMRPPKTNILKPRKFKPIDYDLTSNPFGDPESEAEVESLAALLQPTRTTRASAKKSEKKDPTSVSKKRNIR